MRGASIAHGYWRRPEETEATFGGRLDDGEGPFLRTGDLGFVREGELFVTGRLKELLIFCGKNHYPLDIERTVLDTDSDVSACAAISTAHDSEERLVIVCQSRNRMKVDARTDVIRLAIASGHSVHVHDVVFVGGGQITRTSSGKLQRRALAARYAQGELTRLTPEDPVWSLIELLKSEVATKQGCPESSIDIHAPFVAYGLSSVDAVRITGRLEDHLGRSLSPTLAYEYPTIDALARYLAVGQEPRRGDGAGSGKPPAGDDIAIVGMACRFPGALDLESFERLLRSGTDAVGPLPECRRTDGGPHPVGGYLDEVDQFASEFFSIDASEAAAMDPQQRMLLELSWRAMEDAGLPPRTLKASATGVWVGISSADYALERFGDPHAHPHSHAAQAHSIAANRISYHFDLNGPSISVDTACSSSLVALHLACRAMRAGECDLALVGGVNLTLARSIYEQFERGGYMSPAGRCKAFDADADGYVRGEGAAVVVVKPLARAKADRDRIYGVVRATACNQDGRTNGITAPSRRAQEALLRTAYSLAGIDPKDVQMVEAHGTGTPLGDPIEARAIGAVLGRDRAPDNPCRIGSVKGNIGHLEAGAGIAGLVKTALSLYSRTLYPSCHFNAPNPNCDLDALGLRVQTACEPWPEGVEPIAGVSSFGFGGTNAHAVLSAPDEIPIEISSNDPSFGRPTLLPLSAPNPAVLQLFADAVADTLDRGKLSPEDVYYTAAVRRPHYKHRLAVLGRPDGDLASEIRCAAAILEPSGTETSGERIAFTFGGQGGQWLGMGRDLFRAHPVFRAAYEQVATAIEREAGWSPIDIDIGDAKLNDPSRFERIDRVQPRLFALGVSLSHLLRAWGIEPDVMIGQSMGEIIAATAAGALSVDDGVRAIVRRSALLAGIAGSGSMAMVDLPAAAATERMRHQNVSVAVHTSPSTCVIAGERLAISRACEALDKEGVGIRPIKVDVASHSPWVDPLAQPLRLELASVSGRSGHVPLISSVTSEPISGEDIDAAYLWRNLREPVRFTETVEYAVARGVRLFIEIGPHPVLSTSTAQCLNASGVEGLSLPTLERDADGLEALLAAVSKFYERGHDPNWAAIHISGKVVDLPKPPLPRRRHWTEPPAKRWSARELAHPFLDTEVLNAAASDERVFELALSASAFPELTQHRIAGLPIVSAGAWLELARAAISQALPQSGLVALCDVAFKRILRVPAAGATTVQVVVSPGGDGRSTFAIYSHAGEQQWRQHVSGLYETAEDTRSLPALSPVSEEAARVIQPAELYAALSSHGLTYGTPCQRLAEMRLEARACEVRVEPHEDLEDDRYFMHPLLLDMCLQSVAPLVDPAFNAESSLAPPAILDRLGAFRLLRRPKGAVVARTTCSVEHRFDIVIADEHGVVAEVSGLELRSAADRVLREPSAWRKQLAWSRVDLSESAPVSGGWTIVAPSGPLKDALVERLRQLPEATPTLTFTPPQTAAESEVIAHALIPHREVSGIVLCVDGRYPGELEAFVRLAQIVDERSGPPIYLVTRGACGVFEEDMRAPLQAAVLAAARAGWAEGAFRGAAIDLDAAPDNGPAADSELIWREVQAADRHRMVAYRRGERFAARLRPARDTARDTAQNRAKQTKLPIDPRSTYLVTGGLSDLGLHAARWLLRRGARHLVLCGRSAPDAASVEACAELEELGASVHYKRLDVTDESAVSALAAELSNVAGIIHAAGFVEPCPFGELSEARIASTFEPKAMGAEHLKTHFGGPHLEFMLLYASSAAWLGTLSRGLAHYAAANAYLEAFAAEQTREGATTIAISWPPWNGIGRVRAEAASGYFSRLGVATMSPEEADLVLDSLNVLDRSQIVLCAIDRAYYVCRGVDRDLLRDLDDGPVSAAPAAVTTPYEAPHDVLETRLAEAWQEVLGIARVGRHDSFFSLGGDSIKAATLLNRLRQHMTDTISIVALFEAPTIAHLAAYLRENHPDCALAIENASVAQEPMIVATERAADLLIRIDELGSEEVEVLIQQRSETHAG